MHTVLPSVLVLVSVVAAVTVPLAAQERGSPIGALGQAVRRPPPPTGPVPRLPDGTVDLSGVWLGGGAVNDMERDGGLKPGELDALLQPWARKLRDSRK